MDVREVEESVALSVVRMLREQLADANRTIANLTDERTQLQEQLGEFMSFARTEAHRQAILQSAVETITQQLQILRRI